MMNILNRNTTPTELVIDFDKLSVTFDESSLSLKDQGQDDTMKVRLDKLVLDDATASTVTSSASLDISARTNTSTVTSTSLDISARKRVSFGSISIHSHHVEMGGSGVPGAGPAISLGWEEESSVFIPSVEEYDDARPELPRKGSEMMRPKSQRVNILLESGYTLNQIRTCTEELDVLRKQRSRTVQQLNVKDRTRAKLKALAVWTKKDQKKEHQQVCLRG
jgi:hypothetical protein